MSYNQPSGFDNIIHGAQGFLGGNQTAPTTGAQPTTGGGFINTAQNLLGGQPQNQYSKVNNTIDTAQTMMGHTGQGGPGLQGYVDRAQQALTGHQGPVGGVQGALNTVQGMQGLQQLQGDTQQSGLGGLATTAGGLLGHGQQTQTHGAGGLINQAQGLLGSGQQNQAHGTGGLINQAQGLLGSGQTTHPTQQGSNLGGINSTIDTAQGFMGHTGQGGSGFQGTIDKAQGYLGQTGQLAGQGRPVQPSNIANTATRNIPQQQTAGGFLDKAKGMFGHTDTA